MNRVRFALVALLMTVTGVLFVAAPASANRAQCYTTSTVENRGWVVITHYTTHCVGSTSTWSTATLSNGTRTYPGSTVRTGPSW